ncbi:MAG: thiol-disulfide isomerase [Bryobacteraceae bacterium]|nr:thiol-disulfide isomerase [Bryobacteraceae bacterium]
MKTILLSALAVTFGDVSPILQKHCVSCHRAGEIGPMPLTTYAEARPWAKAMREAVLRRRMPPWFSAQASAPLANDPRLSEADIDVIARWALEGAKKGTGGSVAVELPPAFRPDVVLTMPQAIRVPAREELEYQLVTLPLNLAEDRWVRAAEIRPGVRRVVHHVVAYVQEHGKPLFHNGVTKADILAIYAPGQPPMSCLPGMAKKIPAGADLVLQIHYTPDGKEARDRTSIGIVWAREAPEKRVLTLQIATTDFLIPPGEKNHRVTASGTLPNDALLLSMFPHMHLRGKAFEYAIVEPGGRMETLLRVAPYNFNWQLDYRLERPRLLPKGTRLRCTAWYDNSANNPRNPDPAVEVTYGEQSREEMMVGFFDVAVPAQLDKESFFQR